MLEVSDLKIVTLCVAVSGCLMPDDTSLLFEVYSKSTALFKNILT